MRRNPFFAGLTILLAAGTPAAAEDETREGRGAVTTAKERLVNKAADPQRVDDCKVPEAKRDAKHRRASDCPHLEDRESGREGAPGG